MVLRENGPELEQQYRKLLSPAELRFEPHVRIKERVPRAVGLVRTGDTSQYGNVILESA